MGLNAPPPPGQDLTSKSMNNEKTKDIAQNIENQQLINENNIEDDITDSEPLGDCTTCHLYEDPAMLPYSNIIQNYNGHYSHQNCAACHMPHGSFQPNLIRSGIEWNPILRTCNVDTCHPNYNHQAPLGLNGIFYDVIPNSSCNTSSCHK